MEQFQTIPEDNPEEPPSRRRSPEWLWLAAGAVAMILMAVTAVWAVRYMAPLPTPDENSYLITINSLQEARPSYLLPDKQLPVEDPGLYGVFVRREQDSIFLGTGKVGLEYRMEKSSLARLQKASYDGPIQEVVITPETKIFQDVTKIYMAQSSMTRQMVQPGTLDDLTTNSVFSVWGDRKNGRWTADVICIQQGNQ